MERRKYRELKKWRRRKCGNSLRYRQQIRILALASY